MPTRTPDRIVFALLLAAAASASAQEVGKAAAGAGTAATQDANPAATAVSSPAAVRVGSSGATPVADAAAATAPSAAVVVPSRSSITKFTGNSPDNRLYFTLHNFTANEVVLTDIKVVDAKVTSGDDVTALRPNPVDLTCGLDTVTPALTMPKNTSCTVSLVLPDRGPGRYEASVLIQGGPADGQVVPLSSTIKRDRRVAMFWIFLGLAAGFGINWWRGAGGARIGDTASVRAAMETLARLDPAKPARFRALAWAAADLHQRVVNGATYSDDEIAELGRRVRIANHFLILEQRAGASPPVIDATNAAIILLDPAADGTLLPPVDAARVEAKGNEIIAAKPAAGGVEAFGGAARGAPLPPVLGTLSSGNLRDVQFWGELVVSVIIAVIFAALALDTVYDSKPTWGSFGDQVAAFMIGFGVFAASAAGVSSLLAKAPRRPAS